ncbi:inorganic triphosphatase [Vibrio sp.]|uniref:Inorganic triphosphatase n=1 Tax=Vibrio viridaestus TaxID=2487322 RepID=A0A3N9TI85_9VIBR|nr:inorganic triphosphatase [Vibrio viridaestus]MDC0610663.1 inorganic triphosphatase [Vibrio sp.]RQW63790.1 inorganic triphosphatase [Vibrio viridaestus]
METEIELKFFVSQDYSTILHTKISESKVLQHSRRQLGNTYFDTEDNWLRQHDIGLRIRRYDDVFVQTVKTAGRVIAGLHQRPEYNAEHTSNEPDLSLHPEDIWPSDRSIDQLQNELTPLFSTDFIREQWLISMSDGSQIEVAFDSGVVVAGEKEEPICEVELELKSGQTDALFTLARILSDGGGIRLGNLSKAARGYRLANGYSADPVLPLSLVKTTSADSVETCFINSLEHALSHWHYHEQIYVENESIDALREMSSAIAFINQTLSIYEEIIPRRASTILRQELRWIEQEFAWINSYDHIDDLLKDKGHILRKLDARKFLMAELKALQETYPERESVLKFIHSSRYMALLLDLSRWILARGWQPFIDDKSREKLNESVYAFACEQLNKSWFELKEAFPIEKVLSAEDYIAQQECLARNLYTGIGFAKLYERDERRTFRLPWADLLQGIDDLLTLEPLENLVEKLELGEREQVERWLLRQENSILHAMEQTRAITSSNTPYWTEQ